MHVIVKRKSVFEIECKGPFTLEVQILLKFEIFCILSAIFLHHSQSLHSCVNGR